MEHTLAINESVALRIKAKEFYSTEKLSVLQGEVYKFSCDEDECWVDWILPSSPDGTTNVFAEVAGLRVHGTKCFCLCAAYDGQDNGAFAIGSAATLPMQRSGQLSFFANDAKDHYGNNRGVITVNVLRVQ